MLNRTKKLSILIIGDFEFDIYEESLFGAFKSKVLKVYKFHLKFQFRNPFLGFLSKVENKIPLGPITFWLNYKLIKEVLAKNPDLIFVYRGRNIFPITIRIIKHRFPTTLLFYYNNDDPFSKRIPFYYWYFFKKSIFFYDHIFCYREKNIKDLEEYGYRRTSILMSYYRTSSNYLISSNFQKRDIDVVFIGHFENDGRDKLILELIDKGVSIKLFGTDWEKSINYERLQGKLGNIKRLNSYDYNLTLNRSKIALVIFSKKNNDEYTRRCFEIPAAGAVMFSERTKKMQQLYLENEEVVFFQDSYELLLKLNYYLNNECLLEKISHNARNKLFNSNHEISDRADEILNKYYELK